MKTSSLQKFFKKAITVAGLCAVALPSAAIWTVKDGKILDPNGQPFIFRGVTVDHMAAPDKAVQAIKDAAALGANAVQLEIGASIFSPSTMMTGEQLRSVIQACKDSKVVCVLEPNNMAGYPEATNVPPVLTKAFWDSPSIREAFTGQQDYVIIGLSNQAISVDFPGDYANRMRYYIPDMVTALPGFLIMIDGSGWGQDASKEMQVFAAENIQRGASYTQNLIYSVEMFDAYSNPEKVRDYIATFSQIGAPLVIGGFAPVPYYHPFQRTPALPIVPIQLPAASVMQYAQQYGAGYFAWNWSGSANPGLNLTSNWDATALSSWGELAINDTNGIKATAKRATHFSDSSSSVSSNTSSSISSKSSSSSSSSANNPPIAVLTTSIDFVGCVRFIFRGSAEGSTDVDGDTLTYAWQVNHDSTIFNQTGITISFSVRPTTTYTVQLTVSDGKGGSATASKTFSQPICVMSSSSFSFSRSSIAPSSSSTPSSVASSSLRSSSVPSSTSRRSSAIAAKASCSYVIGSQWGNGFTAAIRVKNTGTQTLNGWSVNWQYNDGSKVTNSWNATLSGSNPYNAKNLGWNANIQPGQTVEFGFQGSKPAGAAVVPVVTGAICQ